MVTGAVSAVAEPVAVASREVKRCNGCGLVQFVTRGRRCRKCHSAIEVPPAAPIIESNAVEPKPKNIWKALVLFGERTAAYPSRDGRDSLVLYRDGLPEFSAVLQLLRASSGMSMREASRLMCSQRTYISKIENGKTNPSPQTFKKQVEAYGHTLEFAFALAYALGEAVCEEGAQVV